MTSMTRDDRYALLESVNPEGDLAMIGDEGAQWRVSFAIPAPGSLTDRLRSEVLIHADPESAAQDLFGRMRNFGAPGVLDTPDHRAHERTPLDFVETLTDMVHDDASGSRDENEMVTSEDADEAFDRSPLAPLREAMVNACPQYNGEVRDLNVALLEAVNEAGDLASAGDAAALWRVSTVDAATNRETFRIRGEPRTFEDVSEAVGAFFDRMRAGEMPGVLDSEDLRACHETPLDFTFRLTEEVSDEMDEIDEADARVDDFDGADLAALREAMVIACPEFGGGAPSPEGP